MELCCSFSVILAHSQNNTLKGNTGGLNTEIKVVYDILNSTNSTSEGEIRKHRLITNIYNQS